MQYALGFLTKKQKELLINKINEPIYKWCQDWIGGEKKPTISLKDFSAHYQKLVANKGGVAVEEVKSVFLLAKSSDDFLKFFFREIGNYLPSDNIANFLIENTISDLLCKIADNVKDNTELKNITDIKFVGIPVIVEINLDFGNIELILDSNMLEINKPLDQLVAGNSLNLTAINDEVTSLSVSFPLDKLSITDFLDLQVGDVIKSKHSIVEPFSVTSRDKEVAVGFLGQSENQLAVLLRSKEDYRP
ncbi:FliM/FliN family flagellar motor C-terminal domain-containing protein [Acinetobacter baumannii]|uniref:flagellar motor switch protein FliM n=1 Tax=Acinetobacter baumannii TaxID=470 RepID=UPI0038B42BF2